MLIILHYNGAANLLKSAEEATICMHADRKKRDIAYKLHTPHREQKSIQKVFTVLCSGKNTKVIKNDITPPN